MFDIAYNHNITILFFQCTPVLNNEGVRSCAIPKADDNEQNVHLQVTESDITQ